MKTLKIIVRGRVQGVYFRATARDVAENLHLNGTVKNESDFVEIIAQGEEKELEKFLRWCHHGSDRARVDKVEVEEISNISMNGFRILRWGD